jgi:hypothetical protein
MSSRRPESWRGNNVNKGVTPHWLTVMSAQKGKPLASNSIAPKKWAEMKVDYNLKIYTDLLSTLLFAKKQTAP